MAAATRTRAEPVATTPDLRVDELPWLTADRNAERLRTNRLLGGPEPRDGAEPLRVELRAAFEYVSGVEKDIAKADKLLRKSRTWPLSEVESRTLREIVGRYRELLAPDGEQPVLMLSTLPENGTAAPYQQRLGADLKRRFVEAWQHFRSQTWQETGKLVKVVLPISGGKEVAVDSRVVPAAAWSSYFPEGYSSSGSEAPAPFFNHVPGLGHATATNAAGEVIYSGLCHDLVDLDYLGPDFLFEYERRCDGRSGVAAGIVRDFLVDERMCALTGKSPEVETDKLMRAIQLSDSLEKGLYAIELQSAVARRIVNEVALAALVTDPPKLRKALAGERVSINLCWLVRLEKQPTGPREMINLLLPLGEATEMEKRSSLDLRVRVPDGSLRPVKVDFKCRKFVYEPSDQSQYRDELVELARKEWDKLLGPLESRELGGDALAKADTMAARARELRDEIARIDRESAIAAVPQGRFNLVWPRAGDYRAGLETELRRLEKNRNTLLTFGRELKDWSTDLPFMERSYGKQRFALTLETLSWLAVVTYLIGETPVFCESGGLGVGRMDGLAKFVSTVADSGDGLSPPPTLDGVWDDCANSFLEQVASQADSLVDHGARTHQELFGYNAR